MNKYSLKIIEELGFKKNKDGGVFIDMLEYGIFQIEYKFNYPDHHGGNQPLKLIDKYMLININKGIKKIIIVSEDIDHFYSQVEAHIKSIRREIKINKIKNG